MKKIEVTKYIADDGKEFDTEIACMDYENNMLVHRQLISQFEIFDSNLEKIKKPKYLWGNSEEKLKEEFDNDPNFKYFDLTEICENAYYVVFKENTNYETIRECFSALGSYGGTDFDFPEKIGEERIVYWNDEEQHWDNFDDILKKSAETMNLYGLLEHERMCLKDIIRMDGN